VVFGIVLIWKIVDAPTDKKKMGRQHITWHGSGQRKRWDDSIEEEEEVILTSTRLTIAYGTDRLTH
jgi:hypothetical protein